MKTYIIIILIIINIIQNVYSQSTTESTTISEIEETGNYQKALIEVKKMLETDSLNEKLWVEMARIYRLNQQFKLSIAAYEKALKINPANNKYILALAKTNNLAGNKDFSIKLYKDFLQFEPNNIMALSDLAYIYSSANQIDSAAKTYEKLYLLDTTNVDYLQKWANNQWFSGQTMEAFLNYKKAFKLDSFYLPTVYDLSRIYINNKSQDSAISILTMNIKHSALESRLYADLGNAIFSQSKFALAIPEYEKAIMLGYKNFEVSKRLGICYYTVKEFENSKQMFESLIVKDTSDYKICMYLGNIYNHFSQPVKAIVFLKKAIKILTPDPMVMSAIYSSLVESYRLTKDYRGLISVLIKRNDNLSVDNRSPDYLLEIATIYESNLKDKEKALKYYQQYYNAVKDLAYSQEIKDKINSKIKKLDAELNAKK